MADQKITDLTEIPEVDGGDYVEILDTSDITDDVAGSSRKVKVENLGVKVQTAYIDGATGNILNSTGGVWSSVRNSAGVYVATFPNAVAQVYDQTVSVQTVEDTADAHVAVVRWASGR